MDAQLFRAKSRPVEARRWDGKSEQEFHRWLGYAFKRSTGDMLVIENRNGALVVNPGEWVVREDDGFYVYEDLLFNAKYEAVT